MFADKTLAPCSAISHHQQTFPVTFLSFCGWSLNLMRLTLLPWQLTPLPRMHLKLGISKKFAQFSRPIFHGMPLWYVNKYENFQVSRNISRRCTQQSDNHIFQKHDFFVYNPFSFLLCFQMDASHKKRPWTFTQIHHQKYYTDLISFYLIFSSDLASHLVLFSSLNNILIILINFTVDRKS